MTFVISREDPGCLRTQQWTFGLMTSWSDSVSVVLDRYAELTRPTLRHKYRPLHMYSRHSHERDYDYDMKLADVPRPNDVYNDAFRHVADHIRVVVWERGPETAKAFA